MNYKHLLPALGLAVVLAGAQPASALPRNLPAPGGVAVVPLDDWGDVPPKVSFGDRTPVAVARHQARWYALLGISLDAAPGPIHLNVVGRNSARTIDVTVGRKDYPTQRLTIRDKRKVEPNPDDELRILAEKEITDRIKTAYAERELDPDFILPAKGPLSSRFGLRRIFNGLPRNPHAGLDVAVGIGAPIRAPSSGVVVNTGDYFFNGNTVFVDHGRGLVSAYMHLSRIDVKEGQTVKRGDLLGAVGSTGRVTGPHLHWAVFLNGTAVDPELFLMGQ
ncbi:MAG TPA: peptidoglycan DD-metalloendopeptidase family protein [Rhodocyclaceae bacterium]|nr:peptidoglycan DD-metalloendopeptidase family protein [Rhodocyclaceae bacterium]